MALGLGRPVSGNQVLKAAVCIEDLDAVVVLVTHSHVTVGESGQALGVIELASALAASSELEEDLAVECQNQAAVIATVGDDDPALRDSCSKRPIESAWRQLSDSCCLRQLP